LNFFFLLEKQYLTHNSISLNISTAMVWPYWLQGDYTP